MIRLLVVNQQHCKLFARLDIIRLAQTPEVISDANN